MSEQQEGAPDKFVELKDFIIDPPSVQLLDLDFCLENHAVVLGVVDPHGASQIVIGLVDVSDQALITSLRERLKRAVAPVLLNAYEIKKAIAIGYNLPVEDKESFRLSLRPQEDLAFDPDTAVTQIISEILGQAVHRGASDLHIETYEDDVDVRLRIDGVLHQIISPLSMANIKQAVSRVKIIAGLNIAERRVAQDGRINAVYEDGDMKRNIDFRVSVVPGPFGEDAVIRILDSSKPLIGLTDLGFTDAELLKFEELIANPEGMLLVTGPSGSGKTTTLYAAIQHVNTIHNKILTVEDPIEYFFPKTNQKQISVKMGFAAFARAFMRQDPDTILIGEIRDEETADVAFRAAQTGHLVLSTLHAGDAVGTISRLRTLGIDSNLLAGSLLGAVAQRLVRRLCAECRYETPPTPEERLRFSLSGRDRKFFKAKGCARCTGTGFKGRIGVYELFVLEDEIVDLVGEAAPVYQIRKRAIEKGMKTLLENALAKARAGLTSLDEILRVVPYRIIAADRK